jgi:hypothetical protein
MTVTISKADQHRLDRLASRHGIDLPGLRRKAEAAQEVLDAQGREWGERGFIVFPSRLPGYRAAKAASNAVATAEHLALHGKDRHAGPGVEREWDAQPVPGYREMLKEAQAAAQDRETSRIERKTVSVPVAGGSITLTPKGTAADAEWTATVNINGFAPVGFNRSTRAAARKVAADVAKAFARRDLTLAGDGVWWTAAREAGRRRLNFDTWRGYQTCCKLAPAGAMDRSYVADTANGLVLLRSTCWQHYSRHSHHCRIYAILAGIDETGLWAVQVASTSETVGEALASIVPVEVTRREHVRQGDVYLVRYENGPLPAAGVYAGSHLWDPETRTLTHNPEDGRAHAPITAPAEWRSLRIFQQRAISTGRSNAD